MRCAARCAVALAFCASAPGRCAEAVAEPHNPFDALRFERPATVHYRCEDGKQVSASYYNSPDNQIALISLDGGPPLLFVSVLSGSGARYAHGVNLWLTKGTLGMLEDITRGARAKPVYADCRAVP
jgi:membrane-bound inhibitor of C-type lysozyme